MPYPDQGGRSPARQRPRRTACRAAGLRPQPADQAARPGRRTDRLIRCRPPDAAPESTGDPRSAVSRHCSEPPHPPLITQGEQNEAHRVQRGPRGIPNGHPRIHRQGGRPVYDDWERTGYASRDLYRKLGELGVIGFDVPEEYGGAGPTSYKFQAIMSEEAARAGVTLGNHNLSTGIVLPYLLQLRQRGAGQAVAARIRVRRHHAGDRDDRARHRFRPGGHPDHREAVRRRHPLRRQRREDLHHRRRRRPT